MFFTKLASRSACVAMVAPWAAAASAQSFFEQQTSGNLRLVRGVEVSKQCDLVDESTRARALLTLKKTMLRQQTQAHISDEDAQIGAKFDAALAEGKAMSADRCEWFKKHPDVAAHQIELVETLAYGGAEKPK